jgi:hypothetical protein
MEDDGWKASIAPPLETTPPSQKQNTKKDKNISMKSKRDTAIQGSSN